MKYLLMLLVLGETQAFAQEPGLVGTSGPERVQLLELFTSESCSSCPPADRWVSELKNETVLFKTTDHCLLFEGKK